MELRKAYIVSAKRTAIGGFLGGLSSVKPREFGAQVIKALLADAGVKPENVDEVICGNVLGAGVGQSIGRTASLEAGIPDTVCAHTTNMVCGSGMRTVMEAVMSIQAGQNDIVVAGGIESMSQAPYLVPSNTRSGNKMGPWKVEDHMLHDALIDTLYNIHMGVTAENIAKKYSISREEQDKFAYASQQKAIAAQDAGKFKGEIVPITISTKKGDIIFDTDEHINRGPNPEKLAKLKPAFKPDRNIIIHRIRSIDFILTILIITTPIVRVCTIVKFGSRMYNLFTVVNILLLSILPHISWIVVMCYTLTNTAVVEVKTHIPRSRTTCRASNAPLTNHTCRISGLLHNCSKSRSVRFKTHLTLNARIVIDHIKVPDAIFNSALYILTNLRVTHILTCNKTSSRW